MTHPSPNMEGLLKEALRGESERAMTMTDPNKELRRFQDTIENGRGRRHWRIVAVAATAGVAVAAALVATHVTPRDNASQPTATNAATSSPAASAAPPALLVIDPPTALPASTKVTALHLGRGSTISSYSFGAVWGIDGGGSTKVGDPGSVFRVAEDGSRILSRTPYSGMTPGASAFRAGDAMLVPTTHGYATFSKSGKATGLIKISNLPNNAMGVGDAGGAWALGAAPDTLVRIDGTSHLVVRTVRLPGADIATLALGGGSLWVGDDLHPQIWRLAVNTGAVLQTAELPEEAFSLAWGPHGVYEGGNNYFLHRLDPTTLKVTATTTSDLDGSWFAPSIAPDGSVWGEPAQGTIAQLDPVTLVASRSIQLYETRHPGGAYGTVITKNRAFKIDGEHGVLYSFPLS